MAELLVVLVPVSFVAGSAIEEVSFELMAELLVVLVPVSFVEGSAIDEVSF